MRNGGIDTDGLQFANPIDNLTYMYDSNNKNLLLKVTDATNSPQGFKDGTNITDDYKYDVNGNMIIDNNKGITQIKYNHLNLPTEIFFGSFRIYYLYNAVGQKVNKKVFQGRVITTTDYLAGFQYKNLFLQFFPHAEGYVNATKIGTGYTFKHVFNYTDHLGNIRLSYSDTNNNNAITTNEVLEENHYYPFGLKHSGYNTNNSQPSYKYKYNGKEYQDELGLNLYDYGARNYDPAIGRWMNVDPLAENSRRWTPYNYAYNNPMYFVDPDGMQADDWKRDINGNMVYDKNLNQFNQSYTLGFGEKYVGSSHYEPTGTNTGFSNTGLSYNEDGTIDYVAILNEVVLSASKPKRSGNFYGIGAGGALGGGISLELGIVEDSKNNYGLYFSFIANVGLGADIGIKTGTATPNGTHSFELNDFKGNSSSYSGSLGPFGVEYGGSDGSAEKNVNIMNTNGFGENDRGYMFGSGSHTLQVPSTSVKPKLSLGGMYSHSKTYVWDF